MGELEDLRELVEQGEPKSKETDLRILGSVKGARFQKPAPFTGPIVTMVTNGSLPRARRRHLFSRLPLCLEQ